MKFLAVVALAFCLASNVNAGCAVDPMMASLGPYTSPSIELSASHGGNKLLQFGQQSPDGSFSVDVAGVGQANAQTFSVPPFSEGNVSITLGVSAMTSQQLRQMRDVWDGILDASQRESLREYERQDRTASRNLGFFGWFTGRGKQTSSSSATRQHMQSRGLTEAQITALTEAFATAAEAMSTVSINFTVFNKNNPYSVSGNIFIWVMSGTISTSETQTSYRVLSDGGVAQGDQGNANAGGEIISLVL